MIMTRACSRPSGIQSLAKIANLAVNAAAMDNMSTDKETAFSLSVMFKLESKLFFIVENALLLYICSMHS